MTTTYVWDGDNIDMELDENGAVIAEYTHEPGQYGDLISEYRDGMTYTHYSDGLGSTLALTDESATITDTFTYDAWGNEIARTGTTPTPFRWIGEVGYYWDLAVGVLPQSKLEFLPLRVSIDSERRRFHAKGPEELHGGGESGDPQAAPGRQGYRRLTFMMRDADVVAVSPASVYRVLHKAGVLARHPPGPSRKVTGFVQPLAPHEHWHVDISYLNIAGTFYYLCSLLDGARRFLVHWEIREQMTEADVETIVQRAREKFPAARPRIISDNGPQFIARDFQEFIRLCGMTHVRTSPSYPQSNGKIERWHRTLKADCVRPGTPLSREDARRLVERFVVHYNTVRLHSAIGYVTPLDKLLGREREIFAARDQKLAQARERRAALRQQQRAAVA